MSKANKFTGRRVGEYQLEKLLHQNPAASIYRATSETRPRPVAVKIVTLTSKTNLDAIPDMVREVQTLTQLVHPHIVPVYDGGRADDVLYIVMEYVPGTNLQQVLATIGQQQKRMAPGQVLRLVDQLCQALDYAHQNGFIHRNVAPGNILLDKNGVVKLSDFAVGLADELYQVNHRVHYAAPEQVNTPTNVRPQSDLYAVGVLLYEMLTGRLPFASKRLYDVPIMHLSDPPPPPRHINPDVSKAVEAVILKAIEKEIANRYTSGAALVTDLRLALAAS